MTDTYTGPGEFLAITMDSNCGNDWAKVKRHVDRYMTAVSQACSWVGMGGRWLDCACGSGYGSQVVRFAQPDFYVGIDQSGAAIDHARRSYGFMRGDCADPSPTSTPAFLAQRIEDAGEWLPMCDLFDVILSLETIEHLTPDIQDYWVKAAASGLVSGGVFVLACPIGNDGPSEYNRYHLHEPSLDGLDALLSRYFKSVEIETEAYVDTGGRDAIQAFAVCR